MARRNGYSRVGQALKNAYMPVAGHTPDRIIIFKSRYYDITYVFVE